MVGFCRGRRRHGAFVLLGVILTAVPGTAWAAKPSPAVGGSDDCGWRVTRDYGPASLTYRLHLSLGGCRWWDGSARSLRAVVTRADGHSKGTAQSSVVPCASRGGQDRTSPRTVCDASVTIAHPEGETARYTGEATWQWNDGPRRVTFDTACTTTSEQVSCADETPPPG